MHSVIDEQKAMLLDGYPRSVAQLEMMLEVCKEYGREMVAIHFELDEEIAKQRMRDRGRSDDTDESMTKRIKQYHDITVPMLQVRERTYPVIRIDANQSIAAIHEQVKHNLHI